VVAVEGEVESSDGSLLARCVAEPDLFGVFYRRHVKDLLRYFLRRTGCSQTAADLTSETFAAAFVKRSSYEDRGLPAEAWLYGIARRQLGTYLRRQRVADKYRRRLGMDPVAAPDVGFDRVEALADLVSVRSTLTAALGELPAAQADAVRLRVVDDLPYADVAGRLGISEGAARVRVSRGLTRLAELLEEVPS
jgi:RNA polymerase sigma-70 factor, ECF subfamily